MSDYRIAFTVGEEAQFVSWTIVGSPPKQGGSLVGLSWQAHYDSSNFSEDLEIEITIPLRENVDAKKDALRYAANFLADQKWLDTSGEDWIIDADGLRLAVTKLGARPLPDWFAGKRASQVLLHYDSMLAFNCTFQRSADDVQRCLPFDTSINYYYSDSGCSNHLASSTYCATGTLPKYATLSVTTATCSSVTPFPTLAQTHVFPVTAMYSGTIYVNFTPGGGPTGCSQVGSPGTTVYYSVGAEVPAATFAAGSIVAE